MSDEDLAMFQRSLPIKSRENTTFGGSNSSDSSDEESSQGRKIIGKKKADSKATGEAKTADVGITGCRHTLAASCVFCFSSSRKKSGVVRVGGVVGNGNGDVPGYGDGNGRLGEAGCGGREEGGDVALQHKGSGQGRIREQQQKQGASRLQGQQGGQQQQQQRQQR